MPSYQFSVQKFKGASATSAAMALQACHPLVSLTESSFPHSCFILFGSPSDCARIADDFEDFVAGFVNVMFHHRSLMLASHC